MSKSDGVMRAVVGATLNQSEIKRQVRHSPLRITNKLLS
jgi:hypothetical protein